MDPLCSGKLVNNPNFYGSSIFGFVVLDRLALALDDRVYHDRLTSHHVLSRFLITESSTSFDALSYGALLSTFSYGVSHYECRTFTILILKAWSNKFPPELQLNKANNTDTEAPF